jgi:hypothetical protein
MGTRYMIVPSHAACAALAASSTACDAHDAITPSLSAILDEYKRSKDWESYHETIAAAVALLRADVIIAPFFGWVRPHGATAANTIVLLCPVSDYHLMRIIEPPASIVSLRLVAEQDTARYALPMTTHLRVIVDLIS